MRDELNKIPPDKVTFIISDCHLSAGRYFEGRLNPHEDFVFDDDMADLIYYFCHGNYGELEDRPQNVELVIAGDFFDYLNVPYKGEFVDYISEEVALDKTKKIINGHPKVMKAIREFASKPGKTVKYLVGNHDAELFFEKVRERITREWDPKGEYPSENVKLIADTDRIIYEEGIEIHHGNQFEASNYLDFKEPFEKDFRGQEYLKIPWGSIYVLKIVNRLKWEREHIDKVRPIKVYVLFGLIIDPLFTIKFMFLSSYYLIKTRLNFLRRFKYNFKTFMAYIKEESKFFQDLESQARQVLDESPQTHTVIFGHTHRPMHKVYPDGKQYINSGTWTKMIQLDFKGLSQTFRRTFVVIEFKEGKTHCELRHWAGFHSPHKPFFE